MSLIAPLPPKENSLAVDGSCKDLVMTLVEVGTSKEFLETTETAEMKEIMRQIECITGYDLVTKTQTKIAALKVDSHLLVNSSILQTKVKELEEALSKDLAKLHGIKPKDVYIRRIYPGSIEILFSLPGNNPVNPNLKDQGALPNFNAILQMNGIAAYNIQQRQERFVDPAIAVEILKNYTRSVVIKSEENGSQLMANFRNYLPILASLSSNVRIVHNSQNNTLEIHGPASARANVLAYFGEIEDLLRGNIPANIVIVPQDEDAPIPNYHATLWNHLQEKAKTKALQTVQYLNRLQPNTLRINSNLMKGCPAAKSFIAALKKLNLDPSVTDPDQIANHGVWGWHGTRSAANVINIAYGNLDPQRRHGQAYGPGEYCAVNPETSQVAYWGETNTLFLFFILKNAPYYQLRTHYVVNNPNINEMYMVPILIATFNNQAPMRIEPENVNPSPIDLAIWNWMNDSGWVAYGVGQVSISSCQLAIEAMYQNYAAGAAVDNFTLHLKRLNNGQYDIYHIDFRNMRQINMRTNYVRKIDRKQL